MPNIARRYGILAPDRVISGLYKEAGIEDFPDATIDMRIGLFLRNLDEEYQITVFRGVRTEAERLGLELLCIQGDPLQNYSAGEGYPFPSTQCIHLDGILILSSVMMGNTGGMPPIHLPPFFSSVPCISLGNRLLDCASIVIQNREPMEKMMEHLVIDHGYRRFLYIGGPLWHRHNTVREHVFRRSINLYRQKHPEIESQVINGWFNEVSGLNILKDYMDSHPNAPVDAVVAANDNMAIGALKALHLSSDPAWRRCAVTGFDDIPQAAHEIPPLTSVHQPLEELGELAVRALWQMMNGIAVPQSIPIGSQIVIRESCGCGPSKTTENPLSNEQEVDALRTQMLQIQRQSLSSEQNLRQVSSFGQQLIAVASREELISHLQYFLNELAVKTFYLFFFANAGQRVEDTVQLAYERHDGRERVSGRGEGPRSLTAFFEKPFQVQGRGQSFAVPQDPKPMAGSRSGNLCIFHLKSGNESLGLIVYSVEDGIHPHICSIAVHIANTEKRLRIQAEEKERSRRLEEEIVRRTQDLVDTNSRLKDEVSRRTEVEAELRKNRKRLESILEAMPIPVVVFSTEGGIIRYANKAFRKYIPDVNEKIGFYIDIPGICNGAELLFHPEGTEGQRIPVLVHSANLIFNEEDCRIAGMVDLSRQRELETEVLRISEMERLRFSLDLHDDICQRLAGISMFCKSLAIDTNLQELSVMIDDTLTLTRQYAHDSFPMELDSLGLNEVLQGFCQKTEKQVGCVCRYRWLLAEKNLPLAKTQEINVYRVIQEALHNAIKHAKASIIEVSISKDKKGILVTVKDNGIGVKELRLSKSEEGMGMKQGMGLRSMQYRARQLGGSCSFRSSPEGGTTVELRIPLAQGQKKKHSGN